VRLARVTQPDGTTLNVVADALDWRTESRELMPFPEMSEPPVEPGLVLGLSRNLRDTDANLRIFARHPRTLVGAGHDVPVDPSLGRLIAEGEIAIILGADLYRANPEQARGAIRGWTLANDITALDKVTADGYSQEGKGTPTPLGPWIETKFEDASAEIEVLINGELRASGSMSRLRLSGARLVAWVSQSVHLKPGDVILSGSPGTAAAIEPGDRVMIRVPGLGELGNVVTTLGAVAPAA